MSVSRLLSSIKTMLRNVRSEAVNLRRRLLAFLLLLMLTMLAGVTLLLSIPGVFRYGSGEMEKLMYNELSHLSSAVTNQYGVASVQGVKMSERLSADVAAFMKREGLSSADLKSNPELLEPLLTSLLPALLNNLGLTDFSGVFITLDMTVNPSLEASAYSKAGLYIRAIDPNAGGMRHETRYLLRGPSALAGGGRLNLQAKWDLEFDIREQLFWSEPVAAYGAYPSLPLSRLLYWCSMSPVQGLNEDVMVCSLPMIDENGKLFGVCGFEISQLNFMARCEPEISDYQKAIFLFSSLTDDGVKLEDALYSGNFAVYDALPEQGIIRRVDSTGGLFLYDAGDASFIGVENEVRLYPVGSPNADKLFIAALLIPKAEFDAVQNRAMLWFALILLALLVMGVVASVILSKRYLKPVYAKIDVLGESVLVEKTNIEEIDQLIERIMKLRSKDNPLPDNLFEDFIEKVKTLTPTEKKVFDYYAKGENINNVQAVMYISAHTLKNHNTHIYQKLGVASRDELLLYLELIKKSGLDDKIFR